MLAAASALLVLAIAALAYAPAARAGESLSWRSEGEAADVCRKQALAVLRRDFTDVETKYAADLAKALRLQRRLEEHLARNNMPVIEGNTGSFFLKQVGWPATASSSLDCDAGWCAVWHTHAAHTYCVYCAVLYCAAVKGGGGCYGRAGEGARKQPTSTLSAQLTQKAPAACAAATATAAPRTQVQVPACTRLHKPGSQSTHTWRAHMAHATQLCLRQSRISEWVYASDHSLPPCAWLP